MTTRSRKQLGSRYIKAAVRGIPHFSNLTRESEKSLEQQASVLRESPLRDQHQHEQAASPQAYHILEVHCLLEPSVTSISQGPSSPQSPAAPASTRGPVSTASPQGPLYPRAQQHQRLLRSIVSSEPTGTSVHMGPSGTSDSSRSIVSSRPLSIAVSPLGPASPRGPEKQCSSVTRRSSISSRPQCSSVIPEVQRLLKAQHSSVTRRSSVSSRPSVSVSTKHSITVSPTHFEHNL